MSKRLVYICLTIVSMSVICFEVLSTRIASVIFVNNYAFMILSFAILGLGSGGIFSFYWIKNIKLKLESTLFKILICISVSYLAFVLVLLFFSITNQYLFFLILFPPYFFSGIFYALMFREYSSSSFKIYAFDLIGASIGAVSSILVFYLFSAEMAIVFISVLVIIAALLFLPRVESKIPSLSFSTFIFIIAISTIIAAANNLLPAVPIGLFNEKDFHHVYENIHTTPEIIDSRWSIYGRSDLVEYSHQNMVKQLFIDGAAGSPMYKFDGDVKKFHPNLYNVLISSTTTIPLLSLKENEKDNMLVIGPGGGKEVLTGLLTGVGKITGIEINKDFVEIVKSQSFFNGGIYTRFPNIEILTKEGRHFIKKTRDKYDLIVMALPSTEQLQSIDNFAMNENYLLTVEAIQDYLSVLTKEGRLIFTVHNRWELVRLLVTTIFAFESQGINNKDALNHIILYGTEYAPTIVIKKSKFSNEEISNIINVNKNLASHFPKETYLPYNIENLNTNLIENRLVSAILDGQESFKKYIKDDKYDISPIYDDSPYFYKIERGVPDFYNNLFYGVLIICFLVAVIPLIRIKKSLSSEDFTRISLVMLIFLFLGLGFMVLEISLFQKLVLYLGSPTISLAVLLSSILIGMGLGSYLSKKILSGKLARKITYGSVFILLVGIVVFLVYPLIFNSLLATSQLFRSIVAFFLIMPLGMVLGIPFPTALSLLNELKLEKYIPWMYGVNGVLSVLGSILAVILSMLIGFNLTFIVGLVCYLIVLIISSQLKTTV